MPPPGNASPAIRRLAIVALTLACAAPAITRLSRAEGLAPEDYLIFDRLFTFNDFVQSLAMLAALALALACPPLRQPMARLAAWIGAHPGQTAMAAFIGLAAGAFFVYRAHPLSMDEYAPWMQAHAFARGQGAMLYPRELLDDIVPPGVQGSFIPVDHASGAAISAYWPGLALLLTPLAPLGLGWCLNPAMGALTLWLLHRLASDAAQDERAGGWATLAALASPQFTVSAMSWYAMPGELMLNLLFLWLLLRPGHRSAFAAGLVGGLCLVMHNPVPHALMALPCLAWLAWDPARRTRLLPLMAGYVPLGLGIGIGWWLFKGAFAGAAQPVVHTSVLAALSQAFSWPDAWLLMTRWQAAWKVWIWAVPGLLLVPFVRRTRPVAEQLLLAAFVLTFAFYLFVSYDQGHGWGYRYIHPVWAALPMTAGLWMAGASGKARQWGAAALAAGLMATPVSFWQTRASIDGALAYRLEPPPGPGEWVVFISLTTGSYRSDLVQNAGGLRSPVYLVSYGERADRALMSRHYPGAAMVRHDDRGSVWRLPPGQKPDLPRTATP